MSDSFEPKWELDDEPPPTPEELEKAAQMSALLAGEDPLKGASAVELEGDLAIARFLRHQAQPPALSAARQDAIEDALMGLWEEVQSTSPKEAPEATQRASKGTPEETPEALTGWRLWLRNWLTPGPRLAFAGALVAVMVVGAQVQLVQNKPAPTHHIAKPGPAKAAPKPVLLAAQFSHSPWQAGQNPFATTRSPGQRLQRVLEHNSQRALASALDAQSRQHLMRLR